MSDAAQRRGIKILRPLLKMAYSGIVPPTTLTTPTPTATRPKSVPIPGNMATGLPSTEPAIEQEVKIPQPANVPKSPKPVPAKGKAPKSPTPPVTVRAKPKPVTKPSVAPPDPTSQSTVDHPNPDNIVEVQLSRLGYTPVKRIITKGEKGPVAHYLKATNRRGQTVYIYLDTKGHVSVKDNDEILAESNIASPIPLSLKTGAFRSAGLQVSGIALQCKNGVCCIIRDSSSVNPIEQNFIVQPDDTEEEVSLIVESPITYPIVRLSEILADPKTVENYVEASTRQLQNDSYIQCQRDLNEIGKVLDQLNDAFGYFMDLQEGIFSTTVNQINSMERSRPRPLLPGPGIKEKTTEGQVLPAPNQNLAYYENRLNETLSICSSLSDLTPALATIKERLIGLTRYLENSKR